MRKMANLINGNPDQGLILLHLWQALNLECMTPTTPESPDYPRAHRLLPDLIEDDLWNLLDLAGEALRRRGVEGLRGRGVLVMWC